MFEKGLIGSDGNVSWWWEWLKGGKNDGDWDNYYIQEYDVLKEFDPSVYD